MANINHKNILHIAYSGMGGQPNVAINMSDYGNNYDKEYYNTILFCGIEPLHENNKKQCLKKNISYTSLTKKNGLDLIFFIKLIYSIAKLKPHFLILHINSFHIFAYIASLLTRTTKKIITVEHHSIQLKTKIDNFNSKLSLFFSNYVIILTEDAKKYMYNLYPSKAYKLHIIPNGISRKTIHAHSSRQPHVFQIGTACRLVKGKDISTILKSIKILLSNNIQIKCRIAGDGDLLEQFEAEAKELGVQDHVVFLGNLTFDELNDFYHNLDAFILSSQGEGFSLAIIESFSYGLPTIGSNVSGIRTLITDNQNGLLFEYQNEYELSNKITLLMNDQSLYATISNNCIADFNQKHEISSCYHKYKLLLGA